MANITCALNITITSTILVTWTHNGSLFTPDEVKEGDSSRTLVLRDIRSSDLGIYKCEFIDTINAWKLRRTVTLG